MTDREDDDDPRGDEYTPISSWIDAVGLVIDVIEGFFSFLGFLAHLVP